MREHEDFNGYRIIWHNTEYYEEHMHPAVYPNKEDAVQFVKDSIARDDAYALNGGTVIKAIPVYSKYRGWKEVSSDEKEEEAKWIKGPPTHTGIWRIRSKMYYAEELIGEVFTEDRGPGKPQLKIILMWEDEPRSIVELPIDVESSLMEAR